MNAAIYYHREGFDTSQAKLMGRHAAGEAFIKAWARHSSGNRLYCYANAEVDAQHFMKQTNGLGEPERRRVWIPWSRWENLSEPGCLFLPGPDLGEMAYQRQHHNPCAFSLCGITHTTASNRVMDSIGDLLVAPTQPWDALICTSNSVRDMVQRVLTEYADYLRVRFKLAEAPSCPVQLPVIPLGVDSDSFAISDENRLAMRKKWREKLGISDDDFVALYVGRLSFHAKVHPMPMFRGLELAARATGKTICFVMAGWFANDGIKKNFIEGAKKFCPSVKTVFLDGRISEVRRTIWFAADIFTSLSDNIQETFGLTPIEAMATGLPVVASDWDGYRETVRHEQDGLLISTWMSATGKAEDIALANAAGTITYDQYIGFQSQFTTVDVNSVAKAYISLIQNQTLRREMSENARQRARAVFDWKVVVKQYESLFEQLAAIRQSSTGDRSDKRCNPLRNDPTVLFQSYPTNHIGPETRVEGTDDTTMDFVNSAKSVSMNSFAIERLGVDSVISAVVEAVGQGSSLKMDELPKIVERDPILIERAILWLAKVGAVKLAGDSRSLPL